MQKCYGMEYLQVPVARRVVGRFNRFSYKDACFFKKALETFGVKNLFQ